MLIYCGKRPRSKPIEVLYNGTQTDEFVFGEHQNHTHGTHGTSETSRHPPRPPSSQGKHRNARRSLRALRLMSVAIEFEARSPTSRRGELDSGAVRRNRRPIGNSVEPVRLADEDRAARGAFTPAAERLCRIAAWGPGFVRRQPRIELSTRAGLGCVIRRTVLDDQELAVFSAQALLRHAPG